MRIIQLIQKPQLRGAEIFACQLSDHLTKMGHELLVVTIFKGDAELPYKGNIRHLNRPLGKRFFDLSGWRNFYKIVKEFEPDIIQANASDTLKFAVSSKILFPWEQPLLYRNANKMGDFISSRLIWWLNKAYISKLSYVISVSKECEKDFIKTFNFPEEKIGTIEIGVEEQMLNGIPNDLRNIYQTGPVLVHIGGFVPEKNHSDLIEIFQGVLEKFPDAQLLLLGKGILQETVKNKVRKLKIDQNVHFLDYRNDVLNILKNSNAFVLPSLIEGLPAVILEAMYCEIPVIAYDVGGIGEVVISGETGWLVEKDNKEQFRCYLIEVIQKEKEDLPEITKAKGMISEKFLNSKIAERFSGCYRTILSS